MNNEINKLNNDIKISKSNDSLNSLSSVDSCSKDINKNETNSDVKIEKIHNTNSENNKKFFIKRTKNNIKNIRRIREKKYISNSPKIKDVKKLLIIIK